MSFDFSTLVTDRTQADVNRVKQIAEKIKNGTASESELAEFNSAAMKGAYNYTDLNRVTAAMEALKAKLEGYGYSVPGYQRIKVPHALPEPEPTSRLPEGYTELAWIESSGTQCVDTGFKPNQDTRIVADIQVTTENESLAANDLFGVRTSTSSKAYAIQWNTSNNYFQHFYNNGYDNLDFGSLTDRQIVELNKNILSINGVTHERTYAAFQCDYSLYICAINNAGTATFFSKMRVHSCQIYDNGTLVRDFVPCKNSGNVLGLYDLANDVFYQNAGNGAFTAGEEVAPPATASVTVVSDNVTEYDPYLWYEFDWPTPETMTIYLLNVSAIRAVLAVMKSTPSVPDDMVGLMVKEANDIELILLDVYRQLNIMATTFIPCGEALSGGDNL